MSTPVAVLDELALQNEDNEFIVTKPASKAIYAVVFVGNTLSDRQMRIPQHKLGGKLFYPLQDFPTVPHGIVKRCQITRLKKAMRGVSREQIDPEKVGLWIQDFQAKEWNAEKGIFEIVQYGEAAGSKTPGLVYKEIFPVQQIGAVAQKDDGVVMIDEGVESPSDIREAQYHYFPNWNDIVVNPNLLPERLRDLEDHLRDRQAKTLSPALVGVGNAFLRSCDQYRTWGIGYVAYQTGVIKETEKTPGAARYDEVAERLFKTLELTRQDALVADMAKNANDANNQQGNIATAISLMAQILAEQKGQVVVPPTNLPPAPATAAEAAKQFVEETEDTFTNMESTAINEPDDSVIDEYFPKEEEEEGIVE